MKTLRNLLLVFAMLGMLFALLAVSAHAQNATVQSGQAQPLQMEGHPQHAAQHMLR